MRDATYAGLRGQRVGRRTVGRRHRRGIHSALHNQQPRRIRQQPSRHKRARVRMEELSVSAAATMPLPPLRSGLPALLDPPGSAGRADRLWRALRWAAVVEALSRARASCGLFARRWIRPVPFAVGLLLVAAAFSATAVAQFVAPALAGLGSAGKWVLRPVEGGLQNALLDNLRSIGAAAAARSVAGADDGAQSSPEAQPGVRYEHYQVGAGDTLAALADRFGITLDTIISFNDIKRERDLKPGRELIIPNRSGVRYVVRRGDNLSRIAMRHGVSLTALLDSNEVEGSTITPGQSLLIPDVGLSENARNRVLGQLFVMPARGRITSGYGYRDDPFTGLRKFHNGIDIANQRGTPVVAAMSGTVVKAGYNGNYGRYLILRHTEGFQTLYAHLDKAQVTVGDRIRQGQQVGEMGNTGYSNEDHLHFSIFLDGAHVDPTEHLR
jgi:murein DD-endopeptidase MepM/ murein hydrolase activator NlpD